MLVVVFDTNVLFSAIGWSGTPRRCLELARTGIVRAVTCEQIMEELASSLGRKLHFSDRQLLETHVYLMRFLRAVTIAGSLAGAASDPKDNMILECAVAAQANYIVRAVCDFL